MLIGRPGRSASRQPSRFRPGPADGWPARPADGKFENFKNQSIAVTVLVPSGYFWDIKGLSNDFGYFGHPRGFWSLFWTISNVFDTIYHILAFISFFWPFLLIFGIFWENFLPFLSIFEAFYLPSTSFRPILDHFSWFLTVFTTLRAISDLI